MLHATIDRAVVELEGRQVIIEQGDRIGVDDCSWGKLVTPGISEPKAIRKALKVLRTALREFSLCSDFDMEREAYTLRVDGVPILLYVDD